jgi:hypothetical protein
MTTNNAINAPTNQFIRSVKVQILTSTGTYTPSTGCQFITTELQAPGGGSGGGAGVAATSSSATGGGQAGGYSRKTYTIAELGANAALVIGSAGTGGASGTNNGVAGGDCTFTPAGAGAVLTCHGGAASPGATATATAGTSPGGFNAGTATGGDVNLTGGYGGAAITINGASGVVAPGQGGNSFFGGGSPNVSFAGTLNGLAYGAGAPGCYAVNANAPGQAAGAGICYITEFCS